MYIYSLQLYCSSTSAPSPRRTDCPHSQPSRQRWTRAPRPCRNKSRRRQVETQRTPLRTCQGDVGGRARAVGRAVLCHCRALENAASPRSIYCLAFWACRELHVDARGSRAVSRVVEPQGDIPAARTTAWMRRARRERAKVGCILKAKMRCVANVLPRSSFPFKCIYYPGKNFFSDCPVCPTCRPSQTLTQNDPSYLSNLQISSLRSSTNISASGWAGK
jgi:hypothetical protein